MMRFLFLSEYSNIRVIKFLKTKGEVDWIRKKIDLKTLTNYDWIISYGYRHLISSRVLKNYKNKIINLHISYLPYNRGADPNYWSFRENTPKGVTIHFIDEGIDTGPILVQKLCSFNESHTLKSSYNILIKEVEKLFFENFDSIIKKKITPKPQIGRGSIHFKKDIKERLNYDIKVNEI